jgi:hypothetical protein
METMLAEALKPQCPTLTSLFRHPGMKPYQDHIDPFISHDWSGKLTAAKLCSAASDIAVGRKVAAQFHKVLPGEECQSALERVKAHEGQTRYAGAPDLGRIGGNLYDAQFAPDGLERYLDEAVHDIGQARDVFSGSLYLMDQIRCLLDEGSAKGAGLLRIGGRPCSFGMVRFMEDGSEIGWHTDCPFWDHPQCLETQQIESVITIVVPLSVPDSGGETIICPVRLSSLQYDANRLSGSHSYAINDAILPTQKVMLRGDVGDVMLFEARYPHRVTQVVGATRYTVSGFIGVCRDGRMVLFS